MTIKRVMRSAFVASLLVSFGSLHSVCFDNKFLPWYPRPVNRTIEKKSYFKSEGLFFTGDSAYGNEVNRKMNLPELWGKFDQRVLTDASVAAGNTNPLRPAWQSVDIKWDVYGKIQGQGFSLSSEYALGEYFSIGGSTAFLHLSSNQKFILPRDTVNDLVLTTSDEQELDRDRRTVLDDLGFNTTKWSYSGLTDTEFHLRYGWAKDYKLKCRQINGGVNLGVFIPTAKQRDTTHPAAIPFGGEKMWGFFCGADASFELKEDIWLSVLANISKRFTKIQTRRIPLKGEPQIFGATSGKVEIDPGVTCFLSPKVTFNDVRNALGFGVQYLFGIHARDVWQDKRDDKTLAIDISKISGLSKWKTEYLLFNLFYDFARVNPERKINPVVSFSWDIPIDLFGGENVAKTQRVGLAIEVLF